ncbi:MAG TPA: YfhO family protein, partial [Gemmatimonadaceae bacterium]|nr:YfhO family protein [Gemmatimonadaceae bacterium]
GFLIGAVQYLPVLEYVPWSPRAGGKGWEHAVSYSMPIEELFDVYLPQFSGILTKYWGRNGIHHHSEYLGAAALLLAGAAFGAEQRKSFRRFWIGVLIVSVLWALGGYTPFYHLIYAIVPGTKFFRAPSTMLMVVAFATSVLVGLGSERLLAGAVSRRYLVGWLVAAGVIALLASVGAFTSLAQTMASAYPFDVSAVIEANRLPVALGGWRSLLFVALAAALPWLASQGRIDRRALGWGLVAVVALDLWSIERQYWMFSPPASVLYASDPAVEYLKKAETGRVLVLPTTGGGITDRDPYYNGDALMVHRIRQVLGYHGNELGNYQRLASREQVEDYGNRVNPAFWRLANTRYLYTNGLLNDSAFKFLVGPVKNSAGSTVYLYRLPGDNPPAWVVPAFVKAGDETTRQTVLDPRFDPTRVAIIDSLANLPAATLTALPAPLAISAKVTRYDAGHIALELSAPAPAGSALVVSENYFPGWTVTVDGRPGTTVRTDYTFIGVPLQAGATKIQLDFHDPAYRRGKTITLIAVLLSLLLAAGGAVADRRRAA